MEPSLAWGLQLTTGHHPQGCHEREGGRGMRGEDEGDGPPGAGERLPCTGRDELRLRGVALCTPVRWDAAPRAEDSLRRGSGEVCQGNMSLLSLKELWH